MKTVGIPVLLIAVSTVFSQDKNSEKQPAPKAEADWCEPERSQSTRSGRSAGSSFGSRRVEPTEAIA